MSAEANDIEAIYSEAERRIDAAARSAYLESACAGNPALRARVEALLRAHDRAGQFLETPPPFVGTPAVDGFVAEGPGAVIGRYKLLERIGEGGMAVVYMAEQERPIRRKVALKIIKLGMDTRQVIARFEAERQALAMMDHPSIAKVLDAGATETGRPYFVMELVQGVSITEYCDKNNLGTKDRLGLFLAVCNAVQHAHQKGIIHRDLKPSNVMVTHHDGRPVPKVIDFGIAKATNQKLTEKTLFTRYAHIIGTPAYMSPEQAELSDLDIDTRTDIYSLGVLLYELLTGTTPFSEEELRKAGYIEMQRVIREQEPAKPSTKLSTLGETSTEVAKRRGCTPDLLRKAVRGDLDWIVMKSLEKDRARRYETASGLAEDIRRHLEHEPVVARGPGATYRLRKFLRRHRAEVLGALVLAVVAGVVVVILSMWNRDRAQLAEAEGFKHRNILSQAREQYAKAEREAALETIRPILASPHAGAEARLLQATILVDNRQSKEAVAVLGNLLDEKPEIAGAAHSLLARILWESGSPDAQKLEEIEEHRKKAEALLPETAEAYFLRAMTALTVKEQLASLDRALQLDSGHYESRRLRAYTYYASRKYDRLRDDALAMTILRPRDPLGHSLRAAALRELAKYQEAIAAYDNAMALTPQADPQYLALLEQRSEVLLRMGDYERVIAEAPAGARDLSPLQYHIFAALTALGQYDEATVLFREIIAPGHEARHKFGDWCAKYVFDTLASGRLWHLTDQGPMGAAFLPMIEAEETYRNLSAKGGRRLTTDGFSARWSPDGSKLAFSLGVHGYSGVAVLDPLTKETDLLIVPGKDPRWSPDGKYIAFVRDCELLRPEELATAERENQHRLATDEEVWIMNADGTAPRRLARGSWPSWASDSGHIYYFSRGDNTLSLIPLTGTDREAKKIRPCSTFASVSPDNQHVSYFEGGSLKVIDLATQKPIAECAVPVLAWGNTTWSPTGAEICVGGSNPDREKTDLWIYDLAHGDLRSVLDGQIASASWSPAVTHLTFCLGTPYLEIWSAALDPNVPTIEALRPAQTPTEYLHEMVAFYTQRIEIDPQDADAYSSRAQYHDRLGDRARATADMRQWSAVQSLELPRDSMPVVPRDLRRVIHMPFDCQLVFSAERPASAMPTMSVAFGQKGRCEMKLFRTPMFIASLLGFGILASVDAPAARADFVFGAPVNLKTIIPVIDPVHESISCLSSDGLEIYFMSDRPGGHGGMDLWVLKRDSIDDDWGLPENLGPHVNSSETESGGSISSDGLTLYFWSNAPGGYGFADLYMTTRATRSDPWSEAVNLGPTVNGSAADMAPVISHDGLELYFISWRPKGYGLADIYVTRRATTNDPWGQSENLGPAVNSPYQDLVFSISPDGLLLLLCDNVPELGTPPRPGGYGGNDMWMTRRASLIDPWQPLVNLGPQVNTSTHELCPLISPDGSTLYFSTAESGDYATWQNWQAPILPIVDFTGDGKVDGKDLLVMVMQLGGTDSLCDIGPYAWGDGVVDFEDLKVLAAYIGTEVVDPTLIAHWAFDETEGLVASDSAGDCDGTVIGGATWQPEAGVVGGALELDGITGCVATKIVEGLGTEPFSVIAWVKGGAPGQVVLSHNTASGWLMANPIDGSLMTKLTGNARSMAHGYSDVVITDGKWHRIGLVWDGAERMLYVDGQEVARDAQGEVTIPDGSFTIGAGDAPGTAWSGLIDDVRIYTRVVRP